VQPADSGEYRVVIFNAAGSDLSELAVLKVAAPPVIIFHPESFVIREGEGFTNRVVASGIEPLEFQWYLNGQTLPGETADALVRVSGASGADIGAYTVRVSNPNGSVLSRPGELLVLVPPRVLVPPLSQSVVEGGSFTLSIQVEGTLPMGYRWRRGSIPVAIRVTDSLTDFFTVDNVTLGDAGLYSVVLTNQPSHTPGIQSVRATITVLADSDGDGMSDVFENANGLNANNPEDKDEDLDGDGMTNYEESVAGADPDDATSYLKVETLAVSDQVEITFLAQPLITYAIEASPSLSAPDWRRVAEQVATETGGLLTVRVPAAGGNAYYRLVTPVR
jgi:hypothetical protein